MASRGRSPSGLPFSSSVLTQDLLAALERAQPADVLDLVLLDQRVEALGQPRDDLVAPLGGDRVVVRDVPDVDAHVASAVLDALVELGRLEHRLGGNAADPQAGPAERRAVVDQRDLQAQLPGAECGRIAACAAAEDDEVETSWRSRLPRAVSLRQWVPSAAHGRTNTLMGTLGSSGRMVTHRLQSAPPPWLNCPNQRERVRQRVRWWHPIACCAGCAGRSSALSSSPAVMTLTLSQKKSLLDRPSGVD